MGAFICKRTGWYGLYFKGKGIDQRAFWMFLATEKEGEQVACSFSEVQGTDYPVFVRKGQTVGLHCDGSLTTQVVD